MRACFFPSEILPPLFAPPRSSVLERHFYACHRGLRGGLGGRHRADGAMPVFKVGFGLRKHRDVANRIASRYCGDRGVCILSQEHKGSGGY